MKLSEALVQIQNSSSWAIYATGHDANSESRYGQRQFENGGFLDGMSFVLDGEMATRALLSFCDGDLSLIDDGHVDGSDFLNWLKEEDWI